MLTSKNRLLLSAVPTLIALVLTAACGGSGPGDEESSAKDPISFPDVQAAASLSDLDPDDRTTSERTKDGIDARLTGPPTLEVGHPRGFTIMISNESPTFRPKDPFSFRQETGEFITAGPIVLGKLKRPVDEWQATYGPGDANGSGFDVTCTAVGNATITFHSEGQSGITSPESAYSITVDHHIECVADNASGYAASTDDALGFSQDSLNWVAFEQDGIVLRVNQIEPVRLEVGDSVDIYSDFDAMYTVDDRDRELRDAKLEFTVGGPIRIDSPPDRQSDLHTGDSEKFRGNQAVFWGFRSGTLTCLDEGEGVYSSVLTGFLAKGGTITQTVSGLVDCEEPPAEAVLDAPPIFRPVYSIDKRPYDRVQFQYTEGHDGCGLPHLHSNVTVYPYLEWYIRGSPDKPLQTTGDAPVVDPDPEGCGFGAVMNLKSPWSSVVVPRQQFLEACDRVELDRFAPASDTEARNLSGFIELCDTLRDQ